MTLSTVLMLFGAGLVGGVMSAMVGGASVVTFPALLAAGLPPVTATASNLVAVSAGNFLAAFSTAAGCRRSTARFSGWCWLRCWAR